MVSLDSFVEAAHFAHLGENIGKNEGKEVERSRSNKEGNVDAVVDEIDVEDLRYKVEGDIKDDHRSRETTPDAQVRQ